MKQFSSILDSPKLRTLGALLFLVGITGISYFPAVNAGAIIDDEKYFLSDPLMTASDGFRQIWINPSNNNQVWPYIPITRSSFWLEHQFSGGSLPVAHTINIILHAISAILLCLLLRHFRIRGAWLTSLLFAVHPVHVQSVAWVTERKNLVSIIFYLLAIWAYLDFEEKKQWRNYLAVLLLFLAAMLSKTSTIMLPLVFILCRAWRHSSWNAKDLLSLLPFFMLAMIQGTVRLWFELHLFGAGSFERGFYERLLTAGHIPFFYLSKFVFPYPLSFVYPRWIIDPTRISMHLPLLSLCLITGLLLYKIRQWERGFAFALAFFIVSLFPVLGFFNNAWTQFSFVSDHWMHIPGLPLFVLAVQGGLWALSREWKNTSQFIKFSKPFFWTGLVLTLSVLTWKQASVYQNEITLWQATLKNNPKAWLPHYNLGTYYLDQKQYRLAIRHFNAALEDKPDHAKAYNNLGKSYAAIKQPEAALESYEHALAIHPFFAEIYNNRGLLYSDLKKFPEALKEFNEALRLNPNFSEAYNNRGIIYFRFEQFGRAIEDYNKALQTDPGNLKAYNNRGNAHFKMELFAQAKDDYTHVLQHDPAYQKAYLNRALVFLQMKQFEKALEDLNKALELNSGSVEAYRLRGLLYWQVFQNQELACADWEQACSLKDCSSFNSAKENKICR
ncbi:MAG: tetratricopeptide repeat protein [SAR324 cluster bacterium]|nr:tetratricopeptide repeat protein [SAR324 cluster bacterium]